MANRAGVPAAIARPLRAMLHFIGSVLLTCVAWPALAATTYNYTGAPKYDTFTNFTGPCTAFSDCANYTAAMSPTGSFTTAAPLAANLVNSDISALVTSYSFSDGINTYTSPNGRIITFHVYTDASGVPTNSTTIEIQEWETGSSPHTSGDRYADFSIDFNAQVANDIVCTSIGTSSGTADACIGGGGDSNTSTASNSGSGTWSIAGAPPPPSPTTISTVPTLSTWALGALATLIVVLGWLKLRRNQRV